MGFFFSSSAYYILNIHYEFLLWKKTKPSLKVVYIEELFIYEFIKSVIYCFNSHKMGIVLIMGWDAPMLLYDQ